MEAPAVSAIILFCLQGEAVWRMCCTTLIVDEVGSFVFVCYIHTPHPNDIGVLYLPPTDFGHIAKL